VATKNVGKIAALRGGLIQACDGAAVYCRIGVARILSGGALFLAKKVDDLVLVVAFKDRLNIPPNLTRPAKNVNYA